MPIEPIAWRGAVSQEGCDCVTRALPSARTEAAEPAAVDVGRAWRKQVVGDGLGDQSPALKSSRPTMVGSKQT